MTKISSEHAAKRIGQLSKICLDIFEQHEKEAQAGADELNQMGLDVEVRSVGIQSRGDSVYWVWHRWIQFYSQYL